MLLGVNRDTCFAHVILDILPLEAPDPSSFLVAVELEVPHCLAEANSFEQCAEQIMVSLKMAKPVGRQLCI